MSYYYEDLRVGQEFTGPRRTITEADIVGFAQLSGDWNPLHTDEEFARTGRFGARIAHGLLTLSAVTGLMDRAALFDGSAVAMLGVEWRFVRPVFIGDTIGFRMTVESLRLTSDGRYGVVGRRFEVLNQRGEVVQEGSLPLLVARRPVAATGAAAPSGA
jgi:acyl dehydratase